MTYADFVEELQLVFKTLGIEYMVIGGGSALLQGMDNVTQDIDIYPRNDKDNKEKIIEALGILGFELTPKEIEEIRKGKDFIQYEEPFSLDLVFAPDGFESYDDAVRYKIEKDGMPCMSIEGIIRSKRAANRPKDRIAIPALIDFNHFLKKKESIRKKDNLFEIPEGYLISENQTLFRWSQNQKRSLTDKISRGIRRRSMK